MKKLILFTAIFLLIGKVTLIGQNLLKLGPSALINVTFFEENVYTNYGGEIGYEFGVSSNFSAYVGGTIHYGIHPNFIDTAVTTKNLLFGISPEFRWHLKERYHGVYVGIGMDFKRLNSVNFTPPVPADPKPTLVNWEVNVGASVGGNWGKDRIINPYLFIGFNPSQQNEYELHGRIGVNIGISPGGN